MCKVTLPSFLAVALVVMVNISVPCVAQEASTVKELPAALTAPEKNETAEAVKELGLKMDQLATEQKAATVAAKKLEEDRVAAAEAAAAKKAQADEPQQKQVPDKPWYTTWWVMALIVVGIFVIAFGLMRLIKHRGHQDHHAVLGLLVALCLTTGIVYGAPCAVPSGQPFVVTGLSVVPDGPESPRRVMIMPGQTRTFRISGCGFGWDQNQLIVGFTGGPAVTIDDVQNSSITIKVKPSEDFGPAYLNLAVRVKGNLLRTPMVLEVQPPEAYSALQAIERHGVGTPSRPAPMIDNTARNAATAAARNASTANESATAAKNGVVTMATKFEQLFGADGKGGVVGAEVVNLRKEVDELKKFAEVADSELFFKDGSSRIDDLAERVKDLEAKRSSSVSTTTSDPGIAEMKAELAKLRTDMNAIMGVTVGSFHRGTIGQKSGLVVKSEKPSKKGKKDKDQKTGAVARPVQ